MLSTTGLPAGPKVPILIGGFLKSLFLLKNGLSCFVVGSTVTTINRKQQQAYYKLQPYEYGSIGLMVRVITLFINLNLLTNNFVLEK